MANINLTAGERYTFGRIQNNSVITDSTDNAQAPKYIRNDLYITSSTPTLNVKGGGAAANSIIYIETQGTGNPYTQYVVGPATENKWSVGIDNDDGTFKIHNGAAIGNSLTLAMSIDTDENILIPKSVTIGTSSIGTSENTLTLGPPTAGGTGEGGQIGLLAAGGSYTSASYLDTWQNQFRILRGPNNVSNAGLVYVDLQSGNTQFIGAVTASEYSGLPNSWLHAIRSGDQTISSGTWASRDIIFNQVASNNFTYNSTTGVATLKARKTYRITARVAWSAAGLYVLKFRIYNQTTGFFTGPTVEMIQSPNGTYNVSDNTLEMIFNVGSSDTDISIRTTSDTNALTGEYVRGDLNTQLIIQQFA